MVRRNGNTVPGIRIDLLGAGEPIASRSVHHQSAVLGLCVESRPEKRNCCPKFRNEKAPEEKRAQLCWICKYNDEIHRLLTSPFSIGSTFNPSRHACMAHGRQTFMLSVSETTRKTLGLFLHRSQAGGSVELKAVLSFTAGPLSSERSEWSELRPSLRYQRPVSHPCRLHQIQPAPVR